MAGTRMHEPHFPNFAEAARFSKRRISLQKQNCILFLLDAHGLRSMLSAEGLASEMAHDHASELSEIFDQSAQLSMYMESILRLAQDVAGRDLKENGDARTWARKKRDIEGLLRRLAESLQREERLDDLAAVMDVFDDLLERHPDFGTQSLRELSTLG